MKSYLTFLLGMFACANAAFSQSTASHPRDFPVLNQTFHPDSTHLSVNTMNKGFKLRQSQMTVDEMLQKHPIGRVDLIREDGSVELIQIDHWVDDTHAVGTVVVETVYFQNFDFEK